MRVAERIVVDPGDRWMLDLLLMVVVWLVIACRSMEEVLLLVMTRMAIL
jgi:hypothetical protein